MLNSRLEHNEIIIAPGPWGRALPWLIDAVFVTNGAGDGAARDTHRRFLAEYGLLETECPLVTLDLHDWESPVSLRESRE